MAGNGREMPRRGGSIGDGGPALAAVVRLPVALSLLPDGGYVVLEAGTNGARSRVRRVSPEGVITTIGSGRLIDSEGDLASLPDGRVLLIDDQTPRWIIGAAPVGPAFSGRDVAGRDFRCSNAAATDGASLLIAACSGTMWWVSQGAPQRRAAAIRALHVDRRGVRAVAQSSSPGALAMRITRNVARCPAKPRSRPAADMPHSAAPDG